MSSIHRTEIALTEDELRQVTLYAVTCAQEVLPLFEVLYPMDHRPRAAVTEAEAFVAGKRRTTALRKVAWDALAAARDVGERDASHAAYAASHAAAYAFLHPIASPHQIKHILGAAVHLALAFESAAQNDREVGASRIRWAAGRVNSPVQEVLRRYPVPRLRRNRFSELLCELDAQLRD